MQSRDKTQIKCAAPDGAAHLLSPDKRHSFRVRTIVHTRSRDFITGGEAVLRCAFSPYSPIFTVSNMLMPNE
jgi:hypothetical protein